MHADISRETSAYADIYKIKKKERVIESYYCSLHDITKSQSARSLCVCHLL